jgi:restriction endonuclease S subunit
MTTISQPDLNEMQIPLISIDEQRYIVSIFSSLKDSFSSTESNKSMLKYSQKMIIQSGISEGFP